MKTSRISLAMAIIFATGMLTFTSCKKKTEEKPVETEETDTEQSTANDNNFAENTASDIESIGGQASENAQLSTYRTSGGMVSISGAEALAMVPCATISTVPASKVFTVDFGTIGCLGADGRTRTGKLVFDFSASSPTSAVFYRNPGFKMSVTSQNYVVDQYQVNIVNKTITNTTSTLLPGGPNPGTNLTWAIVANISIVKPNNGGTVTWTCNRTKELINTSDTTCYKGQQAPINWKKAMVKLNGSAGGTNAKNENFSAVAVDLIRNFNCTPDPNKPHRHPFVSGTITYTPGNRPVRVVNFGSVNDCDFNATVTIKGNTYNVILP